MQTDAAPCGPSSRSVDSESTPSLDRHMPAIDWIWRPAPERAASSRLGRFMKACGFRPDASDYASFHSWSIDDPERFWAAVVSDIGLEWLTPYAQVLDGSRG